MCSLKLVRILLLSATTTNLACAPFIWTAHQQQMQIGNGFVKDRQPLGPWQRRLRAKALPGEPRPEELQTTELDSDPEILTVPSPEPLPLSSPAEGSVMHPSRPVGPPLGTAPLQLRCTLSRRSQREHLETHWYAWAVSEKAALAIVAVWDTLVGAALMAGALDDQPDPPQDAGALIVGSLFLADAIGLVGLIALMPLTEQYAEEEVPGRWRDESTHCPEGLSIALADRRLPVDAQGQLDPWDEAWLVERMVLDAATPMLVLGDQRAPLNVGSTTRCAWARQREMLVAPACETLALATENHLVTTLPVEEQVIRQPID